MTFTPARGLLQKMLFGWAGKRHRELVVLHLGWKDIVGELLAERSKVSGYRKKVLFVTVKNNVWMQELVLAKPKIMKEIKEKLTYEIKDIVFRSG